MNYNTNRLIPAFMLAACFLLNACKVDTFSDIKNITPTVSLVQVSGGTVQLTPDNISVNKTEQLVSKTMGISYAGFKTNESFTATVELESDEDLPDGYEAFAPGECFINSDRTGAPVTIEVPAGAINIPLFFNVTKSAIEKYAGKKMAAKLRIKEVSRYQLNNEADAVFLLMDMSEFGNRKIDVTATYFKNQNFTRAPGTTARFAPLADWIANDAVLNSRATGAGFDANANKMGVERWSGSDKPVINGKIYQTFTLPAGTYQIDVQMGTVKVDRDTYLAVATGEGLPDDTKITTAIAYKEITDANNGAILTVPFKMDAEQQVSIGFLLNFDQGVQKVVQAASIKMYRIESLFD